MIDLDPALFLRLDLQELVPHDQILLPPRLLFFINEGREAFILIDACLAEEQSSILILASLPTTCLSDLKLLLARHSQRRGRTQVATSPPALKLLLLVRLP